MAICGWCGKPLDTTRKKFCNRSCGSNKRNMKRKFCRLCNKAFDTRYAKSEYCSHRCAGRAKNWVRWGTLTTEEIGKVCPICKNEITRKAHHSKTFCTPACAKKAAFKSASGRTRAKALCHPERYLVGNGLCQQCWVRKYYAKNKEHLRNLSRASRLSVNFGLSVEQWDKMYEEQKGVCPICLKVIHIPYNKEGHKAASVDHDHKTKRVRGLVCDHCNRFRIARNTAETAKRLVTYLESTFDGRQLVVETGEVRSTTI